MGANTRPDPSNRLLRVGDWALDIPIPNPALQEWLNGPECEAALREITGEIFRLYVNYLPRRTGTLRRGAGTMIQRMAVPGQTERWYGWVTNRALSYRKTKGKPYPRFIEYGKANVDEHGNPTGTRTPAGMQLRNAAYKVAERRMGTASEAARAVLGGMSGAGTSHHQAHPAKRPTLKDPLEQMKAAAQGNPRRGSLTQQDKNRIRAEREAQAKAMRERMAANARAKKPPK